MAGESSMSGEGGMNAREQARKAAELLEEAKPTTPWLVDRVYDGNRMVIDAAGRQVAWFEEPFYADVSQNWHPDPWSNAALIAKAPEFARLVDAWEPILRELVEALDGRLAGDMYASAQLRLDAALARAREALGDNMPNNPRAPAASSAREGGTT